MINNEIKVNNLNNLLYSSIQYLLDYNNSKHGRNLVDQ